MKICVLCRRKRMRVGVTYCAEHEQQWNSYQKFVYRMFGSSRGASKTFRDLQKENDE